MQADFERKLEVEKSAFQTQLTQLAQEKSDLISKAISKDFLRLDGVCSFLILLVFLLHMGK